MQPNRWKHHKNVERGRNNAWQSGTGHFFWRTALVANNFWVRILSCFYCFFKLAFIVFGFNHFTKYWCICNQQKTCKQVVFRLALGLRKQENLRETQKNLVPKSGFGGFFLTRALEVVPGQWLDHHKTRVKVQGKPPHEFQRRHWVVDKKSKHSSYGIGGG